MPNFTEKAIKETFWRLLEKYPLKQISVRAIAEECGINRNSFYYHFRDIPALLEEIIKDSADALIKKYPGISTLEEAAEAAFNFTSENKKAVLHVYNSINRDIFERQLMQICEYIVSSYINTAFDTSSVCDEDKAALILFYKCELFGLCIEWTNSGMPDDALIKLKHVMQLSNGLTESMIKRCKD